MPYEPRCGHEIDDTNVSNYSGDFSVDQLAKIMQEPIKGIAQYFGSVEVRFSISVLNSFIIDNEKKYIINFLGVGNGFS
ncbi:hypothetical protein [Duganella sp. CF517]|uniref:hypothetical protein n=1 Tax=Duganella sp. CF517 TaxID=1881038 RepID=UPI00116099AA|nr:hypothetical protein [Duganella sp. CF517]